ncbi:hypothetical protein C0J52_26281 [Blattella germanica]|nr:hypothetical protein C0J52_26281 [Blattella germanica]
MVTGGGAVSPAGVAGPGVITSNTPGCVATATPAPGPDTAGLPPQRRTSENRRPARHSKLEKADILEMTVKHLENLQRQQVAMSAATDPNVLNKFRAGFSECAGEVGRFPGLESPVRRRLLQHLANCLNGTTQNSVNSNPAPQPASQEPAPVPQHHTAVQVHIVPTSTTAQTVDNHQTSNSVNGAPNGIFFTTSTNGTGLQLVPTRLPNGDIALVLPSSGTNTAQIFRQTANITTSSPASSPAPSTASSSSSPLPMLIPIPTRTSSTASASSTSSCASTSTSPVAFERLTVSSPQSTSSAVVNPPVCRDVATSPTAYHLAVSPQSAHHSNGGYEMMDHQHSTLRPYSPPLQKPLALVVKKETAPERVVTVEEKPWRPW